MSQESQATAEQFTRNKAFLQECCKRNFVYGQTASIYGGEKGLYDFGPAGCALKENILRLWTQHFVYAEDMLQVETPALTPEPVLCASGHVAKFFDLMVRDEKGTPHRADKLLEAHLEALLKDETDEEKIVEFKKLHAQADAFTKEELHAVLQKLGVVAPNGGGALGEPEEAQLMFATQIGPLGNKRGFLRPETAQGIFVNFQKLLELNNSRMPFAAAQIGPAYRNEISPRNELIRVREFTLAEIEHFCDYEDETEDGVTARHPKIGTVSDVCINVWDRDMQMNGADTVEMSIGEALEKGVLRNETLAYYLARTQLFLLKCGARADCIRFRQHLETEKAHYSRDCWDAELLTSFGWVECVGHADRSAYDLNKHAEATSKKLRAQKVFRPPREVRVVKFKLDMREIGTTFRKSAVGVKAVRAAFESLNEADATALMEKLETEGEASLAVTCDESVTVTRGMVKSLTVGTEKQHFVEFTPKVVEPSFGIGRILYALLEHCFATPYTVTADDGTQQVDTKRVVMRFAPAVAPYKASVLSLSNSAELCALAEQIQGVLNTSFVRASKDTSGVAPGRKYARSDEIGTPFAVMVDFDSVSDHAVTIRERDTQKQVRVPIAQVPQVLQQLTVFGTKCWDDVMTEFPEFLRPADEDTA